jgi:hypothetical protein
MKPKVLLILLVLLSLMLLATSLAFAQKKLLCVTQEHVTGSQTVNSCLANGDRFAVIDEFGLVRILSPEEVALSKAYNPQVFDQRAYGIKEHKEAPWMVPLPLPSYVPGG